MTEFDAKTVWQVYGLTRPMDGCSGRWTKVSSWPEAGAEIPLAVLPLKVQNGPMRGVPVSSHGIFKAESTGRLPVMATNFGSEP